MLDVEAAGFDLVVIDDHLVNPVRPGLPWMDAWTALAAAAEVTSTIRLGPLVSNVVLRHPAMLARHAHTVDQISGGRLELAIGSGYSPTDHRFVEQPEWQPAERAERFDEAVAIVRALLAGEPAPAGRHYDVGDLHLAPPSPQGRPSITVAADGPRALATAVAHADRWVSFGGWGLTTEQAVTVTRRRMATLDRLCEQAGREPSTLGRCLLAGSAAVNAEPIWTSVDAFEDFVGRFREIGIDTFIVYWPPTSVSRDVDEDTVRQVLADVVPRLTASEC